MVTAIQIEKLSRLEKLPTMGALWGAFSRAEDEVKSPVWHRDALKETEARVAAGQERVADWEVAKYERKHRQMKRAAYLLMGLGLMVGSGCSSTSMKLRSLDQDIPAALVAQYKASDKAYADEGKTVFLPLLLHSEEYVSMTTTGFQAKRKAGLTLGLLVSSHQASDFSQDGRLMEYNEEGALLTGLLLSQRGELKRTNDTLREGGGWSVLWGAIGFRERTTGERSITLLWLPIPVGRAPRS